MPHWLSGWVLERETMSKSQILKRTLSWKHHKENKRQRNSFIVFLQMLVLNGTKRAYWGHVWIQQWIQFGLGKRFYSIENLSKFCADDAKKMLSMLNYSQSDIDSFWNLCNAPVSEVMEQLHTKFIPKSVLNTSCVVNQIKKCIWILQIKFNIGTTSKIRTSCLTSV